MGFGNLDALKKKWEAAKQSERTFKKNEIPDGIYAAKVTDVEIGQSQSSNRQQCTWTFEITEGEFAGETIKKWDGLETEENLFYFQNTLMKFGELPDDFDAIEDMLKGISERKPLVKIKVKTNGEFVNVYVNKVTDSGDGGETITKATATEKAEVETHTEVVETPTEAPSEPAAEAGEESVDLVPGMRIGVSYRGEILPGQILGFTQDQTQAKIKLDNGKTVVADLGNLSLLQNENVTPKPPPVAEPPKITKVRKLSP